MKHEIFAIIDDGTHQHHLPQQIDYPSGLAMALSGAEGRVEALHQAVLLQTWDQTKQIYVPLVVVAKAHISPAQAYACLTE